MDPSKTTRIPNPALKAFQKNAVQSYFERQQTNLKENISTARPQSLPLNNASSLALNSTHSRSSLPNNFMHSTNSSSSTGIMTPIVSPTNNRSSTPTSTTTNLRNSPVYVDSSPTASVTPTSLTPTKTVSSPSYQAVFHQSAEANYSISLANSLSPNGGHQSINILNGICSPTITTNEVDHGRVLPAINEPSVPPPPPRRSKSMMPVRR